MIEPTTRDYHGTTIYACPLCAFDTQSRERIDEHIVWRHRTSSVPVAEALVETVAETFKPARRRVAPEVVEPIAPEPIDEDV